MSITTHMTRLAKTFALALAAAAFAVPAAAANNGLVDDWFRDTNAVAAAPVVDRLDGAPVEDRLVDDWFRDSVTVVGGATPPAGVDPATGRPLRESGAAGDATRLASVAPSIIRPTRESGGTPVASQPTTDGFHWSDFGIGAGAMLGIVLLVAGLSLGALSMRHRGGTLRTS